ncbi:hypothetical protein FA10DRAFT_267339, partial [Acaromyces ingoldii]
MASSTASESLSAMSSQASHQQQHQQQWLGQEARPTADVPMSDPASDAPQFPVAPAASAASVRPEEPVVGSSASKNTAAALGEEEAVSEGPQDEAENEAEVEGLDFLTPGEKAKKAGAAAKAGEPSSSMPKAAAEKGEVVARKRKPKAKAAELGEEDSGEAAAAAAAAPTAIKKGKGPGSGAAKGKVKAAGAGAGAAGGKKSKATTAAAAAAAESAGQGSSSAGLGDMSMMSTMSTNQTSTPGQSIFPLTRVARIVKADRDVEMTSKDAIYVIAKATELFIKHLTDSAYTKARLDKKRTITYKELASAVHTQPEFFFLPEVVPQPISLSKALAKRKEMADRAYMREAGLLDGEEEREPDEEPEQHPVAGERNDDDDDEDLPDLEDGLSSAQKRGGLSASNSATGLTNGARKRQSDVQEVRGDGIILGVDEDGDTPMESDGPISANGQHPIDEEL